VFKQEGSSKAAISNHYFGAQTELYEKGDLTIVYVTSQKPASVKTYYANIIVLIKDFYTKKTFAVYEDKAI